MEIHKVLEDKFENKLLGKKTNFTSLIWKSLTLKKYIYKYNFVSLIYISMIKKKSSLRYMIISTYLKIM